MKFLFWSGIIGVAGILFLSPGRSLGLEPKPRESRTGPWSLEKLRQTPAMSSLDPGKPVQRIFYASEPFQGRNARVFGYLAYPAKQHGKTPAMVLVHGGGGTAFRVWAELWAKRGYVALAMDLAGRGPDGMRLPDGGPNQNDQGKFFAPSTHDLWSYHAVAAVIRGVSLVAGMPEVDPQRIGITGISWGGYLTCIVAGLDDRLRVAVPVYGCGFIHENSAWLATFEKLEPPIRAYWFENFEPSRYLSGCKMPVLFVNGTNDFAYPLDSYQKSYRLVKDRTLCVTVNMPHGHEQGWAPAEIGLFVDQHLRRGKPLARVLKSERHGDTVSIHYKSEVPLTRAELHFSLDGGEWQKRRWQSRELTVTANAIEAKLPPQRPIVYFVTLSDKRRATVSTEHEVLER